ncbi:MAG: CoA-binding protein [Victivallales bacterium]|nr:CoA-binding protein [Victivallales bacterium]MCF7888488.1 CoA-binding protein [Victivallales bacterium]
MTENKNNIIVLGASAKPDRYSYMAVERLSENGYNVFPVHPSGKEVAGHKTFKSLTEINEDIHTISLYVGAKISDNLKSDILKTDPIRIIFNPGAENPGLENECRTAGIKTVNACTLVLLQTNSF